MKKYTFTFFRKNTFVNLTGLINFKEIKESLDIFCRILEIKSIISLNINSISLLMFKTLDYKLFQKSKDFFVKFHPKFKGITCKHLKSKIAVNIFDTKCVFMGLKCITDVNIFLEL